MKKEKLHEQWWFWVIIAIVFLTVFLTIIGLALQTETTAGFDDYQVLGKTTCEYANTLIIFVNTQSTGTLDPDTGKLFEDLEDLNCSLWD